MAEPKRQLIGIKRGMMQIFDEQGNKVVCTVVSTEKHVVTQLKSKENDGYSAIQLSAFEVPERKVAAPQKGHFKACGVKPRRKVFEWRVEEGASYTLGQEMGVELFQDTPYIDVSGMSKGKGHQGVMKRHHFAGGPGAHGSGFHRHGGSCGMRTSPGRCLPGQKKSGRMGGEKVTVQSLRVVKVDPEKQIVLIEGAIPGCCGGFVSMSPAVKKTIQKKKG